MEYSVLLANKINGYKSYTQAVKDRVLKQLDNVQVNETMYNKALKALPAVMKHAKKQNILYNKLYTQALKLERHAYAPEMNKLHLKDGTILSTPQKTTMEQAINYLIINGKIE